MAEIFLVVLALPLLLVVGDLLFADRARDTPSAAAARTAAPARATSTAGMQPASRADTGVAHASTTLSATAKESRAISPPAGPTALSPELAQIVAALSAAYPPSHER